MTMNNADWNNVLYELKLRHIARLDCDGYLLALCLANDHRNLLRLVITFYINNVFKGEWILNDCEERRRFFQPCKARAWKKGAFAKISSKHLRQFGIDPEKTITYYMPSWSNFNAMKRHLIKNNQNISRVSDVAEWLARDKGLL
jgi:hypothetical protein